MAKQNSTSSGIGFFGLLTIVFIVLILTIGFAWLWWVVVPQWMPLCFVLLGAMLLLTWRLIRES